jgi:hypothetical protein
MSDEKDSWQKTLSTCAPALGLYRHYKGGLYVVFAMSIMEQDGALLVHYYSVIKNTRWTRPIDDFVELVDGKPRFEFVRKATVVEVADSLYGPA